MRKIITSLLASVTLAALIGTASADELKSPLGEVVHMTCLPVPHDTPDESSASPSINSPLAQPAEQSPTIHRDDSDAGLIGEGRR